jgi:hypothetical protein
MSDLGARLDEIIAELAERGVPSTRLNVIARATDLGATSATAAALAELLEQRLAQQHDNTPGVPVPKASRTRTIREKLATERIVQSAAERKYWWIQVVRDRAITRMITLRLAPVLLEAWKAGAVREHHKVLADRLGVSRRAVQYALTELEDCGHIRNGGRAGQGLPSTLYLLLK